MMIKPYELIRTKDSKMIFAASYAKHIMGGAFCALLEEYPSNDTRVLLLQRVEEDRDCGYLKNSLVSTGAGGKQKTIGYYISLGEVRSEQEAIARANAHINGTTALANLIAGKK